MASLPEQPNRSEGGAAGAAPARARVKENVAVTPSLSFATTTVAQVEVSGSPQMCYCRLLVRSVSLVAIVTSTLVMLGWSFGISVLIRASPGFATMKPNTAVAFMVSGLSLLLLDKMKPSHPRYSPMGAGFLIVLGGLTVLEHSFDLNFGIDELLFRQTLFSTGMTHPGRMSLATATAFAMLGFSLLLHSTANRTLAALRQTAALLAALIGSVAIVGYIYGVKALYGFAPYASMAVHTAILVILLGIASLAAHPFTGITGILTSNYFGGIMARRMLPFAIILPPLIGWIRWQGELAGYYGTAFGLAIFTLSNVVMLTALVVASASWVNRSDEKRRRAEQADLRLAAIVESSLDAIVSKDLNGIVTSWNQGAELLFGYSTSEMVGRSILTLIPSDRRDEEIEILEHIRNGDRVQAFETVRLRKDGTSVDVAVTISPLRDAKGKVIGASKVARDITERKRGEADVQESLSTAENALKELGNLKFALDQHSIVAATDVHGTITYVNDKFCAISQYSREELLGQNHRIINSGYHAKEFFQEMYSAIAAGEVWQGEIKNRAKDGTFYWVDTTIIPTLSAERKPQQYVAIRTDITERKLAEQALKRQAEVLDQSQVFVRDAKGRIVQWTRGAERLYGYSRAAAVGRISHELLRTEFPEPLPVIEKKLRDIGIWEGELAHYHRNGGKLSVDSIWIVQGDTQDDKPLVIEANNDITQRKRTEEILRHQSEELASSNRDLEQFAYAASHDLQEPLRAVSGCTQLLKVRYEGKIDTRADEFIHHAVDGATRMQNLINDLLAFSRVGTHGAQFQPIACAQAVENALKNLSVAVEEKHAVIESSDLPLVLGDLTQLSLLFQNLIANALKFIQGKSPRIRISARRESNEWIISVSDNGIGIEPQYFDRIFVIFQRLHTRTEYPGTGMGLALCKRIIERHGGRIWVESTLGQGTTFSFTLQSPDTVESYESKPATGAKGDAA